MKVEALSIAMQAREPVLLWGKPGIGKTKIIEGMCRNVGTPVETIISSIREPTDFAGLPVIYEGQVRLAAPDWAKRIVQYKEETGLDTVLFFDEISTAAPAVQAALLRVCFDKVVGDIQLPLSTPIVAAANPPEMAAGGWDLTPPLANRFIHLNWEHDMEAWVEGMVAGFPDPLVKVLDPQWTTKIPDARMLVGSFIRSRPQLLLQVPEEEEKAGREFPSPRTWDMASRLLAATWAANASKDVQHDLLGGCVGQGQAIEFLTWLDELDLPNPETLIKDPSKFDLNKYRNDQIYAVLNSVTRAVINNMTVDRWMAGWTILDKAVRQGTPDMAAMSARALAKEKKRRGSEMSTYPIPKEQFRALMPILLSAGF